MKAGCLTKDLLEISEEGPCVRNHGVAKYGTTIRGCGLVVDTIYQVVNSTYDIYMWFFYSSNR